MIREVRMTRRQRKDEMRLFSHRGRTRKRAAARLTRVPIYEGQKLKPAESRKRARFWAK